MHKGLKTMAEDGRSGPMKKWIPLVACLLLAASAAVVLLLSRRGGKPAANGTNGTDGTNGTALIAEVEPDIASTEAEETDEDAEEPMTEEEKREAAEEKLVDDFDNLTDTWTEPATNGVTMADVDAFVKRFATVPKERKEECLQRALNLIPDENVMLLAGVLMDKTQDKELVELVFNDILNRDEDVKKPIMQQIFKDKTHPCWADVAWILDVTDEPPSEP